MLKMHTNHSPDGVVKYLKNSLSKDDYYFDGKAIPGRFLGNLRAALDLPSQVSKKTFSKLVHNINPNSGDTLTARRVQGARSSYEVTMSAPKSFSMILMLSNEKTKWEMLNAHRYAVSNAMERVEHDAGVQARKEGRKTYQQTGKILWSRFDHFTSRPVLEKSDEGGRYISDMNVHSHCIIKNVSEHNGKYYALDTSVIFRNAPFYEAIYHSTLSKRLTEMGFEIERTPDRWEIKSKGITRRTLLKFSNRMRQILRLSKQLGVTTAKGRSRVAAVSRSRKSQLSQNLILRAHWDARLTMKERLGIKTARKNNEVLSALSITPEQAVNKALGKMLERTSTAHIERVYAEALKLSYGKYTLSDIKKAFAGRDDILWGKRNNLKYCTTKEVVQLEKTLVSRCVSGKNSMVPINPEYQLEHDFLNDGQKAAVKTLTTSQDQYQVLTGSAGTGKTLLLLELQSAVRNAGKNFYPLSPTSISSRDVMRKEGLENADTLASFLKNPKPLHRGDVVLLDETGLTGTKSLEKLTRLVNEQHARLIMSGDPFQHKSPEFGSPLRQILDHAGLKVARVKEILRQKNNPQYKKAVKQLAEGKGAQGFALLEKMGAVHEISELEERNRVIAEKFVNITGKGLSSLIVSPTHQEARAINEAVRSEMKFHDRIEKEGKTVRVFKQRSLTTAERQDFARYELGDSVQFFQHDKSGAKAGQVYKVINAKGKKGLRLKDEKTGKKITVPFDASEKFQVFRQETMEVCKGDHIKITQNGRAVNGGRVYNGQVYQVNELDQKGRIVLSKGKVIPIDYGHITHAYVSTSHAAQGRTIDHVIVAQSEVSYPASNTKQFYVSTSRGRYGIDIYTDSKEDLLKRIRQSGKALHGMDIYKLHQARVKRMRQLRHLETFKHIEYGQARNKNIGKELSRF